MQVRLQYQVAQGYAETAQLGTGHSTVPGAVKTKQKKVSKQGKCTWTRRTLNFATVLLS